VVRREEWDRDFNEVPRFVATTPFVVEMDLVVLPARLAAVFPFREPADFFRVAPRPRASLGRRSSPGLSKLSRRRDQARSAHLEVLQRALQVENDSQRLASAHLLLLRMGC
jgi:hypothetical protein